MAENPGWLSNTWNAVSDFAVDTAKGASAAAKVVMDRPGHAAAVFIDGVEKGAADIGGLIIGGVPDLVDWGLEKTTGINLYDGSASRAVSGGLKWGIDGIESLVGIEKPVIQGDGDQFLFGAGRLTGQVVTGAAAIGGAGAIVGAAKGVASGAWTVASGAYKAAVVTSVATNAAVIGGAGLVGWDVTQNDAKITTGAAKRAVSFVADKTGVDEMIPESVKDTLNDTMAFMGRNPVLAKWGSFILFALVGNSALGWALGDGLTGKLAAPLLAGVIGWGLSSSFAKAAVETHNERQAKQPQTNVDGITTAAQQAVPVLAV